MPIVTPALVDRMVAIENANLESRMRPYAERPGNPSGVFIERFGHGMAFVAEGIGVQFFNSVLGTGPDTIAYLDAIEAFYAAHGGKASFEIVPARMTPPLGAALADRGFVMTGFHVGLAQSVSPTAREPSPTPSVTIESIEPTDGDAFELWLDVYLEGWGATDVEAAKANQRGWAGNETWRFYLARVDGDPAGAAVLDVRGATALLGSASTRPSCRGHRVQGALIAKRMFDAGQAGCDLIVGGAYPGTTSARNQQRAGMQVMFTRGIWSHRDSDYCKLG